MFIGFMEYTCKKKFPRDKTFSRDFLLKLKPHHVVNYMKQIPTARRMICIFTPPTLRIFSRAAECHFDSVEP